MVLQVVPKKQLAEGEKNMEKLIEKLESEYKSQVETLKDLDVKTAILHSAYGFTVKRCIIDYLEYIRLDDNLVNYMLTIDDLLNQFYSDWLSFDGYLYDGSLEASVDNSIDIIKNEL